MLTDKEKHLMTEAFKFGFDCGMHDKNNGYSSRDLNTVFNELLEEPVADCGITLEMVMAQQADDKFKSDD